MVAEATQERTTVKCTCGNLVTVHIPHVITIIAPAVSQMLLVPSWDISERKCSGCKGTIVPTFKMAPTPFGWRTVHPGQQEEPSRIIVPNMIMNQPPGGGK